MYRTYNPLEINKHVLVLFYLFRKDLYFFIISFFRFLSIQRKRGNLVLVSLFIFILSFYFFSTITNITFVLKEYRKRKIVHILCGLENIVKVFARFGFWMILIISFKMLDADSVKVNFSNFFRYFVLVS